MFHIRPEGQPTKQGFNFYPWKERKYSIGFVLRIRNTVLRFRIAPKARRIYLS